jgi:predicted 3-demethylubiquinone-9 3-methyltransferase (glyoxalase superfamily)
MVLGGRRRLTRVRRHRDRYGLAWQVVPEEMLDLLHGPDEARGQRAMKAMFEMKKLDIAALRAAADATT